MRKLTFGLAALPLAVYSLLPQAARTDSSPIPSEPGISVVTLNTAKVTDVGRIASELQAQPALMDAAILLLQEVKREDGRKDCSAAELAARLHRFAVFSPEESGGTDRGLAILSRYPLHDVKVQRLKEFNLRFHSRSRFALSAIADTPQGPVHIYNVHLDTRLNTHERLEQLEPVIREAHEHPELRTIIAGDFNSNPFHWMGRVVPFPALHSQAEGIRDYMLRSGFSTPLALGTPTFDYLRMHLDWIWLQGLTPGASRVYPLGFTDHHAVWTLVRAG